MKILIKILKIIGVIFLLLVVLFFAVEWRNDQRREQRSQEELNFHTNHTWKWHSTRNRTQIRYNEEAKQSILRKVNKRDNYIVEAVKAGGNLVFIVSFITQCEPNTSIATSITYPNGSAKMLKCNEDGDALRHHIVFISNPKSYASRTEDLDGFKYKIDFYDWDLGLLDRESTLKKAQSRPTLPEDDE